MDYMLKSDDKRFVINNHIGNDPLSESNLDKTLNLVNRIRLLLPHKSIWLYTGYMIEELDIFNPMLGSIEGDCSLRSSINKNENWLRQQIVFNCDIVVDGQYIDSQRDISLKWRGSKNQRVIDIKASIKKNELVLHCS